MQADGNLVLYDANGKAYFSSQTDGKGGVRATLEVANNLNRFYLSFLIRIVGTIRTFKNQTSLDQKNSIITNGFFFIRLCLELPRL
jgi:hypothetical protein